MHFIFKWRKIIIASMIILSIIALIFGITAGTDTKNETKKDNTETGSVYLWRMETEDEIRQLSDDRTGTEFYLESEIINEGEHSLKLVPSGDTDETKVALTLTKDKIAIWNKNDSRQIIIDIYLPEENKNLPKMFFLGLADTSNQYVFNWIDGVFSNTPIQYGWNQMRYFLSDKMTKLKEDKVYKIYLAFSGMDPAGDKLALSEKFYIDGIYTGGDWATTRKGLLNSVPKERKAEVDKMLRMPYDQLLDTIERKTFDFFWQEANPDNGFIKDRSTEFSACSIASIGFGLTAIPVAVERKWITKDEGYQRVKVTLESFLNGKVDGINGFYYHFVNMKTGKRAGGCEISSVDTALLMAGVLFVMEYYKGTELEKMADDLWRKVDWKWFTNNGDHLSMGWSPEKGFIPTSWNFYNEGMIANIMSIASPTYPISTEAWDKIYRPVKDNKYIFLPDEVLFVYQYSHIWVDFRFKEDKFANYFLNSTLATETNRNFCIANKAQFRTYDDDVWGISASDGPSGYRAYGASEGNNDGTIAPYAPIASINFTPFQSIAAIQGMLRKHGPLIWGKYGFVSAFNADLNWYSREHIGIDEGDIMLMIENFRTGMIWKYFMKNQYIKDTMQKIGFKPALSFAAVKSSYLKQYAEMTEAKKEEKLVITKAVKPINIDGDLSDWEGIKGYFISENMNVIASGVERVNQRNQALHTTFYIQWDNENLYIATDVADSVIVSNLAPSDNRSFYRTDSVEFYIDPERAGSKEGLMKLAILPFDTDGKVHAIRHEDFDPGPVEENYPEIKVASKRTVQGYAIEVKIPFKYLGLKPEKGLTFGFNHVIHNSNNADAKIGEYVRTNIIAWDNVPNIWFKPELWSNVILQ